MKGQNPIRKPVQDAGEILAVQEIFPTLQGEGPRAGTPAVFVRLGGCNLACSFCDTQFETFTLKPLDAIMDAVDHAAKEVAGGWVVITGGEPLRQNIVPLCTALGARGYRVQIETNGTLYRSLPEGVEIICSPKVTDGRYHPVREDLLARVTALKFIISTTIRGYDVLPDVMPPHIPVYVQPMDENDVQKNEANTLRAMMLARRHGYRLSLQLHKILGIP